MASTALQFIDAMGNRLAMLQRDPVRLEQLQRLQQWQAERLDRTYADVSSSPRYRDAIQFFLQDLYGPHDFSRRNRDLRKVLAQWERRLPASAHQAVLYALELEDLTQDLDLSMVEALQGKVPTPTTYATAYRTVAQQGRRQRQIWLVVAAGRALDSLVHLPMIGTTLRLAKLPAKLAGVSALHEFLERGYAAFARMGGARELLRLIEQREITLMRQLFAAARDPFGDAERQRVSLSS